MLNKTQKDPNEAAKGHTGATTERRTERVDLNGLAYETRGITFASFMAVRRPDFFFACTFGKTLIARLFACDSQWLATRNDST
jgi:hypothetical protein